MRGNSINYSTARVTRAAYKLWWNILDRAAFNAIRPRPRRCRRHLDGALVETLCGKFAAQRCSCVDETDETRIASEKVITSTEPLTGASISLPGGARGTGGTAAMIAAAVAEGAAAE
jgi:hypothetical protein